MLRAIIKRELLENLLSFKFIACVLVAVVLGSISAVLQADGYLERLNDHDKGTAVFQDELMRVPVYSFLRVKVFKKPSPMSIFVPGVESRTGSFVTITHREIPASLQGGQVNNEFASIFSFFDLSSIVIGIFSILAILLAYGSISGEKESGMLSLALSNSVPRSRYLVGKYLGGAVSLAVAALLCFLAGPFILLLTKRLSLDPGFFLSLFIIYLLTLLYLSAVLLLGILVSSLTKSSFQSLVVLLAFYLVAVFLLPLTINSIADGAAARQADHYDKNIEALLAERRAELARAEREIPVERSWAFVKQDRQTVLLSRLNPPETIAYFEYLSVRTEKLKEEYALRAHALRQEDQRVRARIDRLRNAGLAWLPPASFARAAELEAGTAREELTRFFRHVTMYWHQYVRYLDEKNAFSLIYSYPYPRELSPSERALIDEAQRIYAERKRPDWSSPTFGEIIRLNKKHEEEIKPLDLGDLPTFTYQGAGSIERLRPCMMNALILILENILLFLLAYFAFARCDPRTAG